MKRKFTGKFEFWALIFLLIIIGAGVLLPKTGHLVLLDELCDAAVFLMVSVLVAVYMIQRRKSLGKGAKIIGGAVILICAAAGVWFGKDIVLDGINGPQRQALMQVQVSRSQAHTGIFSSHYWLDGINGAGEKIRLEISGSDYSRLSGSHQVTVMYYPRTGRVVEVWI